MCAANDGVVKISNKVHGLPVYLILKIMVQLHWVYIERLRGLTT